MFDHRLRDFRGITCTICPNVLRLRGGRRGGRAESGSGGLRSGGLRSGGGSADRVDLRPSLPVINTSHSRLQVGCTWWFWWCFSTSQAQSPLERLVSLGGWWVSFVPATLL